MRNQLGRRLGRSRFLLVSHDAGGNLPPMLALAQTLVRRGHYVTMLGQPSIEAKAAAVGSAFEAFEGIGDYEVGKTIEDQPGLALNLIAGPLPGDALISAASKLAPDAVVVDCTVAGAAAAAESLGQPSAVLFHRLYSTFTESWFAELWPLFGEAINVTRGRYGLSPCESWSEVFDGHIRLYSSVPRIFDPIVAPPDNMRYFGFLVPDAQVDTEETYLPPGDAPGVLVSLSSTYLHQEDLLQKIVDALAPLEVRGLVTTGQHVDPRSLVAADHIAVTDFVPHRHVLPSVEAVVTHAGLGTVASALSAGSPLVMAPLGRDQSLNATCVSALGAGVDVGQQPEVGDIREAVTQVLSESRYKDAALTVASVSEAAGGTTSLAEDLEELLV